MVDVSTDESCRAQVMWSRATGSFSFVLFMDAGDDCWDESWSVGLDDGEGSMTPAELVSAVAAHDGDVSESAVRAAVDALVRWVELGNC